MRLPFETHLEDAFADDTDRTFFFKRKDGAAVTA
jgi:hypothetical protein